MKTEPLNFNILLSSKNWGNLPQFSIWLDDELITQGSAGLTPQATNFTRNVTTGGHELKIRLENKTPADTRLVNGEIVDDMLLNIDSIVIDDVDLGLITTTAKYILDQPQKYNGTVITELNHCVNLGWNGTYVLAFRSPFYLWLLESL